MKSPLYLSRIAGALFFSLNLAMTLSSCDTTEEGYHVGTVDDVYLTTDPATQLRIPADGKAQTINVLSNVDWEIETLDGAFDATASDRNGDGTITVTAGLNINSDQARTASMRIYAKDFNKSVTIELIQAKMNFSMNSQEFAEAPEQGMTYNLSFNCSVDWRFNVTEGEINWLNFNPGSTGGGDWNEIEVSATMLPNYTTEPRSITMQLYPSDASFLEYITLPPRFTLTQAAGTLPSDINLSLNGELTNPSSIPLIISYNSNSPIDEIGVIVSTNNQRFVVPLQQGNSYPQSGTYPFTFESTEQIFDYTLTPFVSSKVGESTGEPLAITFRGPQEGDNQPIK
ncbi:MAG: BACON domain-containing protein [Muribaculaceae bacterium]|nr:BACON domain-containing protein [Muribaculaceae bacterium]